jgi:hypothetical protein
MQVCLSKVITLTTVSAAGRPAQLAIPESLNCGSAPTYLRSINTLRRSSLDFSDKRQGLTRYYCIVVGMPMRRSTPSGLIDNELSTSPRPFTNKACVKGAIRADCTCTTCTSTLYNRKAKQHGVWRFVLVQYRTTVYLATV